MAPSEIQHKINLALVYTENPPAENPMKGVVMLLELGKQHPENVSVLTQLGRLAIKTGQFEKAVQRLSKAVEIAPPHAKANCLLGKAYEGLGDQAQAAIFNEKCKNLSAAN